MNDAPAPAPAAAAVPATIDDARNMIEARKADPAFYKRLVQDREVAARREWDDLHKAAYPAPQQVASTADANVQAAARTEQMWSSYFASLRQFWPVTPENEAEIRGGVIREDVRNRALEEMERLKKDSAWYRRWKDGGRVEREQWARLSEMRALRPVPVK